MKPNLEEKAPDDLGLGGALCGCAFSVYLFYGAYCAFSGARWPVFLPPQLDVVALAFSLISEATSAYVAGAFAGLLGVTIFVATLLLIIRRPKSTAVTIPAGESAARSVSLPQSVETGAAAIRPPTGMSPLPTPVKVGMADRLRDGGSYMFVFEAAEGGLWTLVIQAIVDGSMRAIGFRRPTLHSSDLSIVCELEWEEARRMLEQINELEDSAAAGMNASEIADCLAVSRNEGRILGGMQSGGGADMPPVDYSVLRACFKAFLGEEQYRKFLAAGVGLELRFWQERAWVRFAAAHPQFGVTDSERLDALGVCPAHERPLEFGYTASMEGLYLRPRTPEEVRQFPMAPVLQLLAEGGICRVRFCPICVEVQSATLTEPTTARPAIVD